MYECTKCDFTSEILKDPDNPRRPIFVKGMCMRCYHRSWKHEASDGPFNVTQAETLHYQSHNYDPSRVQEVLNSSWCD